MGFIDTLPLDIWIAIIEYLSLSELASIYKAFSFRGDISHIIRTHAIKIISAFLILGTPKINISFARNGACYKFGIENPRAGQYRHQQDHGKSRPCGGSFNSRFHPTHKHARNFQLDKFDDNKIKITIGSKGKECRRWPVYSSSPPPNDSGPAEMIMLTVEFFRTSLELGPSDSLHFEYHTLSQIIDNTFSDSFISPSYVIRTISHGIPLERVCSADMEQQLTFLPSEWFSFLGTDISVLSSFSGELKNAVAEWQWTMLSFEIKLTIPLPLWERHSTTRNSVPNQITEMGDEHISV